ncbi:MAG: lysophospholipid acyltransferase family protein [Polyangiaceae bacterium]
MRNSFTSMLLSGSQHVVQAANDRAVLLVGNHTCWWDSMVIFWLSYAHFKLDGHAMMDARNLRKLPFLGKIGAYGVEIGDREDGERAIEYGASLLDRARRMVLVFPQGRERPITVRPLGFYRGAAEIARRCPEVAVIPFALRYEFGASEQPYLYASFGAPMAWQDDTELLRASQEAAVTGLLDEIDKALCERNQGDFTPLFTRNSGMAETATQMLSWFTRG